MISATGCFRMYVVNNKEVGRIVLYGNGHIYHQVPRGWLEHVERPGEGSVEQDVTELDVDEPVRATKENLNRTDNYFVAKRIPGDTGHYTLYLYVAKEPQLSGDMLHYETETSLCYQTYLRVKLAGKLRGGKQLHEICLVKETKHVPTDFGALVTSWTERLKADGIEIQTYHLQKLLAKYNLVEK